MEPDEALYRRIRRGELGAFDVLYARYEKRLFGFLLGLLRDRAEAEDLFHEAFLSALEASEAELAGEGAFCAWLFRIARNRALNRIRSRERGQRAVASLPEAEPITRVDDVLGERQMLAALDEAVARLPPTLSELYHLRSSGLRYEEIATVLETPLGTIKSRMHMLVAQLREELKPWTVT